jgi:hypothetical protein
MGMKLRLIEDWHHAYRWSSMRFLAAGGTAQLALATAPQRVLDYAPQWALQGLSAFSLACILLAGLGRITTTEKPACPSPTSSPVSPGSSSQS